MISRDCFIKLFDNKKVIGLPTWLLNNQSRLLLNMKLKLLTEKNIRTKKSLTRTVKIEGKNIQEKIETKNSKP